VVVDFFSTECPPCEKLAPIYNRYVETYKDIKFIKLFRQDNRELALSLDIISSPTLVFFKDGHLLNKRLSGEITEADFRNMLVDIEFIELIKTVPNNEIIEKRDLCIIGTGPAGLTAAIYAARYRVDQVLIGELDGGLMTSSHKICNYPSEIDISGIELTQKMLAHVKQLEVPSVIGSVIKINKNGEYFEINLSNNKHILAKNILLATGTTHRHLGVENEEKLIGRGISYCATCDAMFYKNKTVAVVGGSDSANTAALYLAGVADKVYQIYRGEALRGEVAWIEQIKQNKRIEVLYNTQIAKINGINYLESIELDREFSGSNKLIIDGLFVETGSAPDGTLINQLGLKVDQQGYIETDSGQGTSEPGIWAAGDITTNSDGFRQIVTACSEGAVAAKSIFTYLQKNI
jgi:thioredoxin reductase (NADPH)